MLLVDFATQNQKIIAIGTSWDDQNFESFPHFRTGVDPSEGSIKYSSFVFFGEKRPQHHDSDKEEYEYRRKLVFRFLTDLSRVLELEWQGEMEGGGSINLNGGEELFGTEKRNKGSNGDPGYNEPFGCESLTPWKKLCLCPEPLVWHYKDLTHYLPGSALPSPLNCWFQKLQDRFGHGDAAAAGLLAQHYRNSLLRKTLLLESIQPWATKIELLKCVRPECQNTGAPNISCISCLSVEEIKRKNLWNSSPLPIKATNFWCAKCLVDSINDETSIERKYPERVEMKWPSWLDLRCTECRKLNK